MLAWKNKLICGDNLQELATLEKESIDLIYIDPPFFSNRNYEIIWGDEAEIRSFEDRWEGGINVYIDWMKQRVIELHRVLKPTGSFYLHCDWHAGHYLKVMCDEVFDYRNFQNEIVWSYQRWTGGTDKFQRMHDTLFFYTKEKGKHTFNTQYEPYSGKSKHPAKRFSMAERGKVISQEYTKNRSRLKAMRDIWEISYINSQAKERLGYPTQKPETLLDRIVKTSSNENDIVLDAFCGCGTALAVAQKLKRRWIGIDISPSAIALIKKRLSLIGVIGKTYEVIGMPQKVDDLKKFKHFEFQYWVVNEMHGTPSPKKVGDMGIDGLSFLNHYPIQVKQSENVGRNVVDNFETALRRYYGNKAKELFGYIIAFSFTKGTYEEVARAKKDGFKIELITVQDILDHKISILKDESSLFES